MAPRYQKFEFVFEKTIWNFRLFVIIPVIFSLLSSVLFFVVGSLDVWEGFSYAFNLNNAEGRDAYMLVSHIIGGVDFYLIGIVLLIFAFGLYELFVSRIDAKFQSRTEFSESKEINLLDNDSLEDLKGNLVRVIIVALIVSFFKKILILNIERASDLMYVALSILIITVSYYLMHSTNKKSQKR